MFRILSATSTAFRIRTARATAFRIRRVTMTAFPTRTVTVTGFLIRRKTMTAFQTPTMTATAWQSLKVSAMVRKRVFVQEDIHLGMLLPRSSCCLQGPCCSTRPQRRQTLPTDLVVLAFQTNSPRCLTTQPGSTALSCTTEVL